MAGEQTMHRLCNGPGKLCIAFAVGRGLNGSDACGDTLYLKGGGPPGKIVRPRVGIGYAGRPPIALAVPRGGASRVTQCWPQLGQQGLGKLADGKEAALTGRSTARAGIRGRP